MPLNDHLYELNNAKCFTLIDIKDGFFHILLDEKSSEMTTMHSTYGRYRWEKHPFGINSAPKEFQMRLMRAFEGLKGIVVIADDILVHGNGEAFESAEADHDRNFDRQRLSIAPKLTLTDTAFQTLCHTDNSSQ